MVTLPLFSHGVPLGYSVPYSVVVKPVLGAARSILCVYTSFKSTVDGEIVKLAAGGNHSPVHVLEIVTQLLPIQAKEPDPCLYVFGITCKSTLTDSP